MLRGDSFASSDYLSSDYDDIPQRRTSRSSIGSRQSRAILSSRCSSSDGNTTIGDDRSNASTAASGTTRNIHHLSPNTPFVYIHDEVSLRSPLPQKYGTLRCYVERKGSELYLYIEKKNQSYIVHPDGGRFLLMGRKISSFFSGGYEIYKSENDERGCSKIAQITCGFGRSVFEISYSNAMIIRHSSGDLSDAENGRSSMISSSSSIALDNDRSGKDEESERLKPATISYRRPKGDRAISGPRLMDVDMPIAEKIDAQNEAWRCKMLNKPAEWNPHRKCYVLPFHGRASVASSKNFQLVTPDDSSNILLLFGRASQDRFSLDFQWPLSPLQAFAIALSSFEAFR